MIYVLELEDGCYYIGYTTPYNFKYRMVDHFNGNGSSWSKQHKPIKIVETMEGDKLKEKEITLKYKNLYGWDKVKGAGWTY